MLRVLNPDSRLGGDPYGALGKDTFPASLDYSNPSLPSLDSSRNCLSTDTMEYHGDHRNIASNNNSRSLMPIRSNTSYMAVGSNQPATHGSFMRPAVPMRQETTFSPTYSNDSPVHPNSTYLVPVRPAQPAQAVQGHAVGQARYPTGSYSESAQSESDRMSMTRTSASPINPNVNAVPQMPSNLNANMQPTWHGFIHTTPDGLMVIEACLNGTLQHCPRRPHDRERASLIRSGSVFVYEESTSGIKRWTDGLSWSPSRIMGNFLVYRELQRPFAPGEKKRANKPKNKSARTEPYARSGSHYSDESYEVLDARDRKITGSLVDSYDFKRGGLLKKTLSVTVNGCTHHLIAYYTIEDAKDEAALFRPGHDPRLVNCHPRKELLTDQKFRSPIHDPDDVAPYAPYMPSMAHLSSYPSQHSFNQPSYQPFVPNVPASLQSGYHATSQSLPNIYAPSSSNSASAYPGLATSPAPPQNTFDNIGQRMQPTQSRASTGMVSPLQNIHMSQSPVHQHQQAHAGANPSYQPGQMPATIPVSSEYQSFSPDSNYTTAAGATFNQNFGFDQPNHSQFQGSINEMNDDSPVAPDQIFGGGSGHPQASNSFHCYNGTDTQHLRHDTLSAFDDRAPTYSNQFS